MCLLHIIYFFAIATSMEDDTASEVALTKWVAYIVMLQMFTYLVFAFALSFEALREIYQTYRKRKLQNKVVPDSSSIFALRNKSEFRVFT